MAATSNQISPKFAGALFFGIYALLFMIFTKYTLLALRDTTLLPFFSSLLVAGLTGALVGALLGNALAKTNPWYRPFLIGIAFAILSLILGSIGILGYYYFSDPHFLLRFKQWQDYFVIYGVIFFSLLLTVGVWLIPLTGLVAIYFNKHFFPGLQIAHKARMHQGKQ